MTGTCRDLFESWRLAMNSLCSKQSDDPAVAAAKTEVAVRAEELANAVAYYGPLRFGDIIVCREAPIRLGPLIYVSAVRGDAKPWPPAEATPIPPAADEPPAPRPDPPPEKIVNWDTETVPRMPTERKS